MTEKENPNPENREGVTTYNGVLEFFSETGTEGAYWAFLDEKFMHIPNDSEICGECGYLRDYIENAKRKEVLQVVQNVSLTDTLEDKMPEACKPNNHNWKLQFPDGAWSYEGLHVLKDSDELTIYDKKDLEKVVWQGTIALTPFTVFKDDAFGMWIHNDQIGIDRETWATWFMNENPAKLTTKSEPLNLK